MLSSLDIQNYALIEDLHIDFQSGFSVITGETGAGKSIMLGALGILLGNRADTTAITPGAKRCVVEAIFSQLDEKASAFFQENDLDFDDGECIIRRELTDTGKSRAFINDTPVSLAQLKELGNTLIDIHSQHQNLLLNNADFQMNVLDSVAGDDDTLAAYRAEYAHYLSAQRELQQLERDIEQNRERLDYLDFQHRELASAALTDGEQEELEQEQLILENAESIKQTVFDAQQALVNTTDNIHSASRGLDKIAALLPAAAEIIERLDSCAIELDDIEQALTANDISYDPQRLETVSERLDTIYSLQKKYHKANIAELLDMQSQLEQQLNIIVNHEEVVAEKRKQCEALRKKALSTANMLTAARREAAIKVERELTTRLQPLGMPYVDFVVELTSLDELAANGQEKVRFLFSANKSMPPRSLEKIASGGEIARVMLTLKAMLSTHKQLPTIIFDEIDTGVSGRIANEMATVMQQCARESHAQVISITHNPQIAARGDHHYRIYKQDSAQSATTHMELLDANQRVEEIAKMLSGSSVSEAAKTNARDLLKETKGDKRR
ncbi:MAG: DNA repair protein RecN [Bacteroidaceae bacterium]|nr:DNA repair protein RecN [Bacteroidaceae bacterium]